MSDQASFSLELKEDSTWSSRSNTSEGKFDAGQRLLRLRHVNCKILAHTDLNH
jgi:hypothetical protein